MVLGTGNGSGVSACSPGLSRGRSKPPARGGRRRCEHSCGHSGRVAGAAQHVGGAGQWHCWQGLPGTCSAREAPPGGCLASDPTIRTCSPKPCGHTARPRGMLRGRAAVANTAGPSSSLPQPLAAQARNQGGWDTPTSQHPRKGTAPSSTYRLLERSFICERTSS